MRALTAAALFAGLAFAPVRALADGVETRSYQTVERMGNVLVDARQDMDTALFNITVRQHQINKAEEERDAARSGYGPESRDAAVTQARYEQVRQEALADILRQLSVMVPRFQDAEESNRDHVKKILERPANFEALIKGHLRAEHNPAVMGVLVYLATRRLNQYAQELYAKSLMGKLDMDIKEVQRSIQLVDELLDPDATPASIEDAWAALHADWELGTEGAGALDELDMLLEGE